MDLQLKSDAEKKKGSLPNLLPPLLNADAIGTGPQQLSPEAASAAECVCTVGQGVQSRGETLSLTDGG